MLNLFSTADRGVTYINKEDMKPYSDNYQVFTSSMDNVFRDSWMGAKVRDAAVFAEEAPNAGLMATGGKLLSGLIEKTQPINIAAEAIEDIGGLFDADINLPRLNPAKELLEGSYRQANPKFTKEQLVEQGRELPKDIEIPKGGLTLAQADIYKAVYEEREIDRMILANARPGLAAGASEFAGGLVASIADPINFIPIFNGVNRAATAIKAGGVFSRATAKAIGIGSLEAATGALLSDAVSLPEANRTGAGYDFSWGGTGSGWERLQQDVLFAGGLGGFLGGLGRIIGKGRAAHLGQDGMVKATADLVANRPVDVAPILEDAARLAESQGVKLTPEGVDGPLDFSVGRAADEDLRPTAPATPEEVGRVQAEQMAIMETNIKQYIEEGRPLDFELVESLRAADLEVAEAGRKSLGLREALACILENGI